MVCPTSIKNEPFYGLTLDDEQKIFVDSILNPTKKIIFCNAKAGSGKTTLAIGAANMLVYYKLLDGIIYIVSPVEEHSLGFRPGTTCEKASVYFEPLYQAMIECNINPNTAIINEDLVNQKEGNAFIKPMTHTFLRGSNFRRQAIIIEEAQNYTVNELKKTLTRCHDDCKVIVIGHNLQCDLPNTSNSGFIRYLQHFDCGDERVAICNLTKNYRGWISSKADEL